MQHLEFRSYPTRSAGTSESPLT